jgi:hypothetical protein
MPIGFERGSGQLNDPLGRPAQVRILSAARLIFFLGFFSILSQFLFSLSLSPFPFAIAMQSLFI